MTDKNKTCLSVFLFFSSFILSGTGLAIGWIGWDLRTGVVIGIVSFVVLVLVSGGLLATIEDQTWFTVSLPLLVAMLYSIIPDFIFGPFDDAAVVASGAIFTFALAVRKMPEVPKWIIFPLLASGLYALVGGFIPTPIDELLVYSISGGAAAIGVARQIKIGAPTGAGADDDPPGSGLIIPDDDDVIEGDYHD